MPKPLTEFADEAKKDEGPSQLDLREHRRIVARLEKKLGKLERVEAIVHDAIRESFAGFSPTIAQPIPPKRVGKGGEEIACLHISDTQVGKVTTTYNVQVARERLHLLADKVREITEMRRSSAMISECRVYLGGDMVEGEDIFPGQAHETADPVIDQACRQVPEMLAETILSLLSTFQKVRVCCVRGNHGRASRHASKNTNWDTVAYICLEFLLQGQVEEGRLEVIVEDKQFFHVDRVFDWGNLIVHGDQIRGGFGGFPWYGAGKKAWGWADSIKAPWDYLWFGHFHTPASFTLNERHVLANGTTESDNEYAQEQLAASGHPCQRLAFFNASHGLIADCPIFLHDRDARLPSARRAGQWLG